jgi:hypothetical protein
VAPSTWASPRRGKWNRGRFSGVGFKHSVLAGGVGAVSKAVKTAAALCAGPSRVARQGVTAALTAFEPGAKWSASMDGGMRLDEAVAGLGNAAG